MDTRLQGKKILFITTSNLTSNPRLLKEVSLCLKNKIEAEIIAFELGNWSDDLDKQTVLSLGVKCTYLPATRVHWFKWLISSLIQVISSRLSPIFKTSYFINSMGHTKRSFLLLLHLSFRRKEKYDLIVAHNLGSLYPAFCYAKMIKGKFAFDVEDYHPGETILSDQKHEEERRKFLMKNILKEASYISYASPLIGEYSLSLLNSGAVPENTLVNNCFSEDEFFPPRENFGKTTFVWFSQNINYGRGLELLIPVLRNFNGIRLTLIGNIDSGFYDSLVRPNSSFISVLAPIPQRQLHNLLSEFDIGLSVDLSSKDLNRELALTNKIIAYFQAGLFILATDTKAQKIFMERYKEHGVLVTQNSETLEKAITHIIDNIEDIRSKRYTRFMDAKVFSWERESTKLTNVWELCV